MFDLPFDRVLNLIWWWLRRATTPAAGLDQEGMEKAERKRREIEGLLAVHSWASPLSRKVAQADIDADAPWWWGSDAGATDDFMAFARTQGVSGGA